VNTAHAASYATDGSTGRPLFEVPAAAAGTFRTFKVNAEIAADPRLLGTASSAGAGPGDGSGTLAILGTQSAAVSGGSTPAGALASLISTFGSSSARASATAEHEVVLRDHLLELRDGFSGVSIDEELIELTRSQRAFEAVAKVMTTADEMLDTLMNLK